MQINNFIKRKITDKLRDHLKEPEITLIVGPRQAGKTTLMKKLQRQLQHNNKNTVFYNIDKNPDLFTSQEKFLQNLELDAGKEKTFVFIDEIQRKENAGLFLKALYDRNLDYKFIVSGSGSLDLKSDVHESLAGRKLVFVLDTLSFTEFINYKTDYQYEDQLQQFFNLRKEKSRLLMEEYLNFGGYPRVVQSTQKNKKRRRIDEIIDSYLHKDITDLLRVRKTDKFSKLIKLVSDQVGRQINYSNLSNDLQINQATIKNYLYYAEKTYILDRVTPFFTNKKKELIKAPIAYFSDLGFRNYSLGQFGQLDTNRGLGVAFENLVYNQLKAKTRFTPYSVHYWRTQSQTEVDFVVTPNKRKVLPVEVKYKELQQTKVPRALRSFLKKYEPESAYIVNLTLNKTIEVENTEVHFITIFDLASSKEGKNNKTFSLIKSG